MKSTPKLRRYLLILIGLSCLYEVFMSFYQLHKGMEHSLRIVNESNRSIKNVIDAQKDKQTPDSLNLMDSFRITK